MKLAATNGVLLMSESVPSAGAMLRTAREAQGLHIAALAVALKVPVNKLEALETDRFDLLPDTVFVRALAASICRTLKIDPAPILESLPLTIAPSLKTDALGINAPFRMPGDGFGSSFLNQFSRPLMLAVLVFLTGAIVLFYFPFTRPIEVASPPESKIAVATPVRQELTPVATENLPVPGAAVSTPSSSLALSSSGVPLTGKTATAAPATAVPGSVAGAPPAKASGAVVAGAILVFKTSDSSWIEVIDAAGVVQVRKIMTAGEVLAVSGARPLSVVIGRSDVTQVQARGKPLDLTQVSKNGVARFEVK